MTFVILTAGICRWLYPGGLRYDRRVCDQGRQLHHRRSERLGGMSWLIGLGICMAMGTAIGFLHGLGATRLRLPPFIVTLGGMTIWRGLTLVIDGAPIAGFDAGYRWWGRGELYISIPIWIFALVAIGVTWHCIKPAGAPCSHRRQPGGGASGGST
jgi:ribose/xylose/arabinose/galactoside ABC-type transport system permease subunit